MQYALVSGNPREAFPGGKGTCPICSAEMIAKCGKRILQHWAHAFRQNCDSWWENETQWHRNWENLFPEECREISYTAPDGEIHRADVVTPTSIVIEFQHSAMSDEERHSREQFYRNLIWVIDGRGFKQNFDILHLLPDPDLDLAQDLVWKKGLRQWPGAAHRIFWRLSENPGAIKDKEAFVQIHSLTEIKEAVENAYRGHHQYDWIRPRKTWLDSTCPVYIDLGDDYLVRLESYGAYNLPCVKLVSKRKFLHDVSVETSAQNIAERFYPIRTNRDQRK